MDWFRIRLLRRNLAGRSHAVRRAHHPLSLANDGVLDIFGFVWDPHFPGWSRPGLHCLSNMAGPIQHLRASVIDAWRGEVSAALCVEKGFWRGPINAAP